MEAHAQAVEDHLIDSLQFKLRPSASYVTNRRSVTFWPSGGNSYSNNGVRLITRAPNADQWLDPPTVNLFLSLRNTDTAANRDLAPKLSNPWCLFRRARSICGGQIVEDLDD